MQHGVFNTIQSSFSTLYRLADLCVIICMFFIAMDFNNVVITASYQSSLLVSLVCFLFFSQSIDLYRSWRTSSTITMISYTLLTWSLCCAILIALAYFSKTSELYSRLAVGIWFTTTASVLIIWRVIFRSLLFYLRRSGVNVKSVIIIGCTKSGIELAKQITENPQLGLNLIGFYDDRSEGRLALNHNYPLKGTIEEGVELVNSSKSLHHVYIAMPMSAEKRVTHILNLCSNTTATVHIIPDFLIYNLLNPRWQYIGNIQALSIFDSPLEGINITLKRIEDIIVSSIAVFVCAIPMLFISLLIKLTSKGPVIFKQTRYGIDGSEIVIYKFRTMLINNQDNLVDSTQLPQATKKDERVTPLGLFLRRTSLDELPQFFNVLGGSMSVVGPRPHAVIHNEHYRNKIDRYMLRHKVKPGITGWAQVNGWRGETDSLDKMEQRIVFDLAYINRWSLLFDLKILWLTIFKGFINKNAY